MAALQILYGNHKVFAFVKIADVLEKSTLNLPAALAARLSLSGKVSGCMVVMKLQLATI